MSCTRRTSRLITPSVLFLALVASAFAGVTTTNAAVAQTADRSSTSLPSGWTARPEIHPGTTRINDLAIPMSDGTVLRGDVVLPADVAGEQVPGRFPVIVTITAYNKSATRGGGGLAGVAPSYLVQRGYAHLTVDARGTGSSAGTWCAFCSRENQDAGEIVEWAHSSERPWSNGAIGMNGPSYMGISQLFAAQHQPAGLKAIFPQVPAADVYRDVVASGGALDVGFIPAWLGLVTGAGLVPPAYATSDPTSAIGTLFDHLMTAGTFTAPLLLGAATGGEPAYDGPFYDQRSPIVDIDKVRVPAFFIGGEYDLFQRGTPLDFEALQRNGVPTKMILGPWDHLQGSSGAEVAMAGYGTLPELQLRWFDRYVRGVNDPGLDRDIAPLTYFEQGTGDWRTAREWVGNQLAATSYSLSGSAVTGSSHGALTRGAVTAGTSDVLPIPVAGLCTRSATQWTAGASNAVYDDHPCNTDNQWNDRLGVVFETGPLTEAVSVQGPINARLHVSSSSGDGMLAVAVSDVAPDGTVSRFTGGWQVISHRALDTRRSRYLDGQLVQAWHPFTREAKEKLAAGEIAAVDVEIFPTGAKILPGHRLRLSVQATDVPHLAPTLPDLTGSATVLRIHNSVAHPSVLTLPTVEPRRVR